MKKAIETYSKHTWQDTLSYGDAVYGESYGNVHQTQKQDTLSYGDAVYGEGNKAMETYSKHKKQDKWRYSNEAMVMNSKQTRQDTLSYGDTAYEEGNRNVQQTQKARHTVAWRCSIRRRQLKHTANIHGKTWMNKERCWINRCGHNTAKSP